ncbi:MAG: hypothetical protein JNK37_12325 [Verrucomicrobiales bacterium]|nr:hypothetical protein [Verrucomicrobiales bacterium]
MENQRDFSSTTALDPVVQEHHSLNTVRDLLFGSQAREIHERISQVEEKFHASAREIEERLSTSLREMESRITDQIGHLDQALRSEIAADRTEREQRASATGDDVKTLGDRLDERFAQLTSTVDRIESEGRLLLFERLKSLKDELGETSRTWNDRLDRELSTLRDGAAPRSELARRLIELGQALHPADADTAPAQTEG